MLNHTNYITFCKSMFHSKEASAFIIRSSHPLRVKWVLPCCRMLTSHGHHGDGVGSLISWVHIPHDGKAGREQATQRSTHRTTTNQEGTYQRSPQKQRILKGVHF